MSVSSEILYSELDEKIKESLQLKPLDVPAAKLVEDFISELAPDQHKKHIKDLRIKPLMLDRFKNPKIKKRSEAVGLSAKEKRSLALYNLPKEKQKYESFVPLHKLWNDYMKTLLGIDHHSKITLKMAENKLLKADYHGAVLKVTSSKCSTYLNTVGIVVKETKNMFYLITEDDKLKGIPKYNSLFEFTMEGYVFEIFGNNFRFRAGERCARKFKTKPFMLF